MVAHPSVMSTLAVVDGADNVETLNLTEYRY